MAVTQQTAQSISFSWFTLQWRRNEHDGVWNHRYLDCLFNRLFRRRSKKTSKLLVTGLCEGNPHANSGFPSQRASNAENVSIWWRHHEFDSNWTYVYSWGSNWQSIIHHGVRWWLDAFLLFSIEHVSVDFHEIYSSMLKRPCISSVFRLIISV